MSAIDQGRRRVVIEGVTPEVDGGLFAIKRTVGEKVTVEADVFADGHDVVSCVLKYRKEDAKEWTEVRMKPLVNDRWRAEFPVFDVGRYRYTIDAWLDRFLSWRSGLAKKVEAAQDVSMDLLAGAALIEEASREAAADDKKDLQAFAAALRSEDTDKVTRAFDERLARLMETYSVRRWGTSYDKELLEK